LTISADLKILKQPNHVKQLRILSTIFEILKPLPLKAPNLPLVRGGAEGGGVLSMHLHMKMV
jgi:di/tripeptidase